MCADDAHIIVTVEKLATLQALLHYPAGYQSFYAFLKMEFALENLLFWTTINDFRSYSLDLARNDNPADHAAKLKKRAIDIYDEYVCLDGSKKSATGQIRGEREGKKKEGE